MEEIIRISFSDIPTNLLTVHIHVVIENPTRRVKTNSTLTQLKIKSRIKQYNGQLGSNPQRNCSIFEIFFKFDKIRWEIEVRNYEF